MINYCGIPKILLASAVGVAIVWGGPAQAEFTSPQLAQAQAGAVGASGADSTGAKGAQLSGLNGETEKTSKYRIRLLTVLPGTDYIHSRWGHTALYIYDKEKKRGRVYDYGMFSFDQSFILNFLKGKPSFWLDIRSINTLRRKYKSTNRAVFTQEIFMPESEASKMRDYLEWKRKGKNKYYKYDHYRDNCTTVIRDLIDNHTGKVFSAHLKGRSSDITFRDRSLDPAGDHPLWYLGMDVVLNGLADVRISVWEDVFLPLNLMVHLDRFRQWQMKQGEQPIFGPIIPLVRTEDYRSAKDVPGLELGEVITDRSNWYIFYPLLLAVVILFLALPAYKPSHKVLGFVGYIGQILFYLTTGILGCIVFGLWSYSSVPTFNGNLNILVLNPLHVLVCLYFPYAVWKGQFKTLLRINQVSLGLLALGTLINIFQIYPQDNWNFIVSVWITQGLVYRFNKSRSVAYG